MEYRDIATDSRVSTLRSVFEEHGLDWQSHLNTAIKQSDNQVQSKDLIISTIVEILKKELRAAIIRKINEKAETSATTKIGKFLRAIWKLFSTQTNQ